MPSLRAAIPILILVALSIGALFFIRAPNTVILKEDGFHPRVLTVKAGERVTFVNGREKYFWPASDFHPSHALFPAFDPKKPIAPGDSWSFTFEQSGIYGYHDHLAAYFSGLIRVADTDGSVPDSCNERTSHFQCWQNQIMLALSQKGVDAAYDTIARLYSEEPAFAASCHYITHNIGLASYQYYRSDPQFILSPKAVACAAGFYHGFMEGYLGATGDARAAAAVCDTIGEKIGALTPDARLQCYHGVGHGAIEMTIASVGSFRNLDDVTHAALALCESASEGVQERYRCVSGIYNGIVNFYITGEYGLSSETEDPFAFCARQLPEYQEACYGNLNSFVVATSNSDFSAALERVLLNTDAQHAEAALRYVVGIYARDLMHADSFALVVEGCRQVPNAYASVCVPAFAHGLLEHGIPGREYEKALAFCGESLMTDAEHRACYSYVLGTLTGWYSKEKTEEICASVSPALRRYCTRIE